MIVPIYTLLRGDLCGVALEIWKKLYSIRNLEKIVQFKELFLFLSKGPPNTYILPQTKLPLSLSLLSVSVRACGCKQQKSILTNI